MLQSFFVWKLSETKL